jgi:pimeloyl-ACP methyl ester carboxylesterase
MIYKQRISTDGEEKMEKVISKDGTAIAYERTGEGPVIILVSGALGEHTAGAPLVALLKDRYAVIAYDRRGRGDSGDTQPYALEREIEDIDTLVRAAGGSAFLYGHSSGAVLALEATASGLSIPKLALYEPPFIVDDSRSPVPVDYIERLNKLVSEGRRGDAVEYFMISAVQVPGEIVNQMRSSPMWSSLEAMAHTLAYDGMIMGSTMSGKALRAEKWSSITQPVLVMDGGASPDWMHHSASQLTGILANATRRTLKGQTHSVDPTVLAPVLDGFFASVSFALQTPAKG